MLATRSVHGTLDPSDVTVPANALLTALAVERAATVDPGAGGCGPVSCRRTRLGRRGRRAGRRARRLTERGLAVARENAGPLGPPASLLDQTVLTVSGAAGPTVRVPMRCLFALSGMGFVGGDAGEVRVSATAAGCGWTPATARWCAAGP